MNSIFTVFLALVQAATFAGQDQPKTALPLQNNDKQIAIRVLRTSQTTGHFINDCVAVYPDGHYSREHSEEQPSSFSRTPLQKNQAYEVYVFEGRLTSAELDNIVNIVNGREFKAIRSPEKLHMSSEFLEVSIFRQNEPTQTFKLSEATDYKPNQGSLKPLFAWIKALEKKKHDVSKREGNSCALPHVP